MRPEPGIIAERQTQCSVKTGPTWGLIETGRLRAGNLRHACLRSIEKEESDGLHGGMGVRGNQKENSQTKKEIGYEKRVRKEKENRKARGARTHLERQEVKFRKKKGTVFRTGQKKKFRQGKETWGLMRRECARGAGGSRYQKS